MHAKTHNSLPPAVILFGSPGSGKGTQAKLLRQFLEVPHISTGDMLRVHIEAGDGIGHQTERLIRSGKLVSDEVVNELVEARLAEPDCRSGVILDGYPRTIKQADVLLSLARRFGFQPAVVHLMVDHDRIVARLSGRRQCPVCGTLYSLKTNPSKVAGICDLDGSTLVTREDDRESVIRERLTEYELQTRPLLDYFREAGVPVSEVVAASAMPEQVLERVCGALKASGVLPETQAGAPSTASDASVVP